MGIESVQSECWAIEFVGVLLTVALIAFHGEHHTKQNALANEIPAGNFVEGATSQIERSEDRFVCARIEND